MYLLWPKPPLTCSSHQTSTLGPLSLVVAACVKDARPSRWLAPLERPRWPQHRRHALSRLACAAAVGMLDVKARLALERSGSGLGIGGCGELAAVSW